MNPYLASGIILILRWLQLIGSQQVLGPNFDGALICSALVDDTKRFSDALSNHALASNGMLDSNGKVQ